MRYFIAGMLTVVMLSGCGYKKETRLMKNELNLLSDLRDLDNKYIEKRFELFQKEIDLLYSAEQIHSQSLAVLESASPLFSTSTVRRVK